VREDGLPAFLDDRLDFDKHLHDYLRRLDGVKPVVWAGDLNVAHTEIDLTNPKTNTKNPGFTVQERASFSKLLSSGFVDTFRHFHPDERDCYSFWTFRHAARAKNIGWRLDYFITSARLISAVTQAYHRKHVLGSDHCPVVIHLRAQ